jgi:chromosome segregation ATPase
MTIPSVVQGLIETEDGKVFELDSPKGAAWVEAIGSFRFEPSGNSKAYTVRREPSGYWYGCRKVAGKVRKKYIGKTSEVSTAKLEEIAVALENAPPPVPRVKKVAQVAEEVAQVAEDRLATLESEVAMLRQVLEALQEALPGKSEAGGSEELPKVDNAVAEGLQNELSNLRADNEWLRQKLAESRDTIETVNWGTEARNEQLEALRAENQRLQNDLGNSQTDETFAVPGVEDSEFLKEENEGLKRLLHKKSPLALSDFYVELQKLRERHREYRLKTGEEHRASIVQISELKRKIGELQAENQRLHNELGNLQSEREDLAQLKKEAKEAAAEIHREGNAIKVERLRWQRELSDARAELADAKATMLNQGNKIRELERGYSFKPNPAESRLRLEIGNLQAELAELKQKSAAASKDLPEAADLYNQLKAKRKKSSASLADVEKILEIIEGDGNE